MTAKEKLVNQLVILGLYESQAHKVVDIFIPVYEDTVAMITGPEPVDPCFREDYYELVERTRIHWHLSSHTYEPELYKVWLAMCRPIALKWIDENVPNAWYRVKFE